MNPKNKELVYEFFIIEKKIDCVNNVLIWIKKIYKNAPDRSPLDVFQTFSLILRVLWIMEFTV